jgi:hypothetical protein
MTAAEKRAAYIKGLRTLASALEDHPEIPLPYEGTGTRLTFNDFLTGDDPRAAMAETARLLPCTWSKQFWGSEDEPSNSYFSLVGEIAGLKVELISFRNAVCERVVTGTREVTEKVKDPAALAEVPEVEVTRTVEDYVWDCGTLLGPRPAVTA